jgi:hypothetical protein
LALGSGLFCLSLPSEFKVPEDLALLIDEAPFLQLTELLLHGEVGELPEFSPSVLDEFLLGHPTPPAG